MLILFLSFAAKKREKGSHTFHLNCGTPKLGLWHPQLTENIF